MNLKAGLNGSAFFVFVCLKFKAQNPQHNCCKYLL